MDETLETIRRLATERLALYEKIAQGGHSPQVVARIEEITGKLASLWDTHRRELAAIRWGHRQPENPRQQARRALAEWAA